MMKNYQKPFLGTIVKDVLSLRCQATACNANINSCNTFQIPDVSIQDCEFTVCIQTAAFVPDETGSIVFDCGPGTGPFTADFITVSTVLGGCTIPGGPVGNLHTITVDVTPDLPDTCNGNMINYFANSGVP